MSDEERVVELRELFPVINHWTYLYNGAVHACPKPVSDAMRSFLEEWENGGEAAFFSGYETFCRLKEKFSALVGANERNIVITESTSAALNLAAQIIQPRPDQNVVVTDLAFMTDTYLWLASRSAPGEVRFVKSRDGKIYMEDLAEQVDERTAAVNICAVTVGSGFRYNLPEVHAITAKYNTPLIVDAAQALGLIDYDVNNPHQNFVAGTASKWLMGPAGVGFLYLDDSFLEATPPSVGWLAAANADEWDVRNCRLHSGAMRFQGGIPNLAGVTGALAALEFLDEVGQDFIERRVHELTTYALEELEKIGVDIWTPRADNERAGIVFFRTPGEKTLHDRLKSEHVYCGRFLGGIRIDPNFYNTYEEIDRFLAIVRSHVANRKKN
jgi:selenocysteine lyase/cysteine desulfurase